MFTSRRDFLKQSTLLAVGSTIPVFLRQSAATLASTRPRGDRVLVVIQLTGGNDGLNTVVPYGDELYARYRRVLRIPKRRVLKIDDYHGLHPAMTGMHELLGQGRLAIVQGVGYPNPSRSHFRSMDIWHTASTAAELPRYGWLGRVVDRPGFVQTGRIPGAFVGGQELPLALRARRSVPVIGSLEQFRLEMEAELKRTATELVAVPRQDPVLQFLQRTTLDSFTVADQLDRLVGPEKSAVRYPSTPLAQKLRIIARIISAGLGTRIFYTSIDGFDTHSRQAPQHQRLLQELSDAVAAFTNDLAVRGELDRVLVMTFSEFGRRVAENGSAGTDHGTAEPMFLVGGQVNAGLVGNHPPLDDLVDGDLKFHTDFRQVYATVLEDWLGVPSEPVLMDRYEKVPLFRG